MRVWQTLLVAKKKFIEKENSQKNTELLPLHPKQKSADAACRKKKQKKKTKNKDKGTKDTGIETQT